MEYRRFGRTGLLVSITGIGTGGASRLGLSYGATEAEAIAVLRHGLALGVNYFDTAQEYETEDVLGRAISGHRQEVVISSKVRPVFDDGTFRDRAAIRAAVELSLSRIGTDVIDIFHLHRVTPLSYRHSVEVLAPALEELRDEGKIRFLAISESSGGDPNHTMLGAAVNDDCWDVIMTGFNLLNQSAREVLFSKTMDKNIGVEIMASARSQFSQPELLARELRRLVEVGDLAPGELNSEDPLDFLRFAGDDISLTEACYRFAGYEPGVHVVLVGTGKTAHLKENIDALNRGPLPKELHEELSRKFGHLRASLLVPGRQLDAL